MTHLLCCLQLLLIDITTLERLPSREKCIVSVHRSQSIYISRGGNPTETHGLIELAQSHLIGNPAKVLLSWGPRICLRLDFEVSTSALSAVGLIKKVAASHNIDRCTTS